MKKDLTILECRDFRSSPYINPKTGKPLQLFGEKYFKFIQQCKRWMSKTDVEIMQRQHIQLYRDEFIQYRGHDSSLV